MTDDELEKALKKILSRFDAINQMYLRKIARQIRKIGELSQSSINQLVILAEVSSDVEEITRALMTATVMTRPEIQRLYVRAMADVYTDPRFTRAFSSGRTVPPKQRAQLVRLTENVALQTQMQIENLSNTTVIAGTYRNAIDRAILATASGITSYSAAARQALKEVGYAGMQVRYPSGYHRRLDTAIRQNIVDGTRQIAMHGASIVGDALGYDAVELSAHLHSAPDHEPVQGRIFLKTEFEKMQAGLPFEDWQGRRYAGFRRPIGEWNCMHFPSPFSTKFSRPRYTETQLQDWAQRNQAGCVIDGKHITTYQAQQMMRKLETRVRRWKDIAVCAQIAGEDQLRRECQLNINRLAAKYSQIAAASGLRMHKDRMSVPGFKMMKV